MNILSAAVSAAANTMVVCADNVFIRYNRKAMLQNPTCCDHIGVSSYELYIRTVVLWRWVWFQILVAVFRAAKVLLANTDSIKNIWDKRNNDYHDNSIPVFDLKRRYYSIIPIHACRNKSVYRFNSNDCRSCLYADSVDYSQKKVGIQE